MEEERIFLTTEEALSLLPDNPHSQVQSGFMIIGCDMSKESCRDLFDSAEFVEIGGDTCIGMGHGIVVVKDGKADFISHDKDKLNNFLENRNVINK